MKFENQGAANAAPFLFERLLSYRKGAKKNAQRKTKLIRKSVLRKHQQCSRGGATFVFSMMSFFAFPLRLCAFAVRV
ncbi:MAG: hypothetical protein AABM64_17560 [Pseudomonadota bacterium]